MGLESEGRGNGGRGLSGEALAREEGESSSHLYWRNTVT